MEVLGPSVNPAIFWNLRGSRKRETSKESRYVLPRATSPGTVRRVLLLDEGLAWEPSS